jgi:hypothetical protein
MPPVTIANPAYYPDESEDEESSAIMDSYDYYLGEIEDEWLPEA